MGAISLVDPVAAEPQRSTCPVCVLPVLMVVIDHELIVASAYEWEPRARCYVCATIEGRANKSAPRCEDCKGSGFTGDYPQGKSRAEVEGERNECPSCEGRGFVGGKRVERPRCKRCGGEGYIGEARPEGRMLAIDCAWSDEGHVRLIGVNTKRRRGEALYPLHLHGLENPVIVAPTQTSSTLEVAA